MVDGTVSVSRMRRARAAVSASPAGVGAVVRYREALAAAERLVRSFRGAGLRIGTSAVVHAVTLETDEDGITRPAPACRQGYHTIDRAERLRPDRQRPVSCRRCRALGPALSAQALPYTPGGADQPALPLPGVPPRQSYPPAIPA